MVLGAGEHTSVRTTHLLLHRTWFSGELLSSVSWAWKKVVTATPDCNRGAPGLSSRNPQASEASVLPHLPPVPSYPT